MLSLLIVLLLIAGAIAGIIALARPPHELNFAGLGVLLLAMALLLPRLVS